MFNDQRDWLNNDVPYIITPAECAAYLQLGTNEERDLFIEHFWDLRNPEPELGENSFKEEHRIYSEAVKIVLDGRFKIEGRRVILLT